MVTTEVAKRQAIEKRVARMLIAVAKRAGYYIKINNGEELITPKSQSLKDILAEMFSVDEERIYLYNTVQKRHVGWIFLVYGNDGWDVICDYTINLESLVGPVVDWANTKGN